MGLFQTGGSHVIWQGTFFIWAQLFKLACPSRGRPSSGIVSPKRLHHCRLRHIGILPMPMTMSPGIKILAKPQAITVAMMVSRAQCSNLLVGLFSLQILELLQEHGLYWRNAWRMDLNSAWSFSQVWWHTYAQCWQRSGCALQVLHRYNRPNQGLWHFANVPSASKPVMAVLQL